MEKSGIVGRQAEPEEQRTYARRGKGFRIDIIHFGVPPKCETGKRKQKLAAAHSNWKTILIKEVRP